MAGETERFRSELEERKTTHTLSTEEVDALTTRLSRSKEVQVAKAFRHVYGNTVGVTYNVPPYTEMVLNVSFSVIAISQKQIVNAMNEIKSSWSYDAKNHYERVISSGYANLVAGIFGYFGISAGGGFSKAMISKHREINQDFDRSARAFKSALNALNAKSYQVGALIKVTNTRRHGNVRGDLFLLYGKVRRTDNSETLVLLDESEARVEKEDDDEAEAELENYSYETVA